VRYSYGLNGSVAIADCCVCGSGVCRALAACCGVITHVVHLCECDALPWCCVVCISCSLVLGWVSPKTYSPYTATPYFLATKQCHSAMSGSSTVNGVGWYFQSIPIHCGLFYSLRSFEGAGCWVFKLGTTGLFLFGTWQGCGSCCSYVLYTSGPAPAPLRVSLCRVSVPPSKGPGGWFSDATRHVVGVMQLCLLHIWFIQGACPTPAICCSSFALAG
jgi:hypothetical protein